MAFNNQIDKDLFARGLTKPLSSYLSDLVSTQTRIFTPSIYSGTKIATTNVTGQSEAVATGSLILRSQNDDAPNYVYIGLGNTISDAQNACTTGVAGTTRFLLLPKTMADIYIENYKYYAWLSVGGDVTIRLTQGV
jgi:hypothetical protein